MEIIEKYRGVLSETIEHFGVQHQINKTLEEMHELGVELCRMQDKRTTIDKIVEETADVIIMLRQLAMIVGEKKVNDMVTFKIRRLSRRMSVIKADKKYEENWNEIFSEKSK